MRFRFSGEPRDQAAEDEWVLSMRSNAVMYPQRYSEALIRRTLRLARERTQAQEAAVASIRAELRRAAQTKRAPGGRRGALLKSMVAVLQKRPDLLDAWDVGRALAAWTNSSKRAGQLAAVETAANLRQTMYRARKSVTATR